MSDNKLKIRIQIQQPKKTERDDLTDAHESVEEDYPDLDALAVMEKPPFDWRKIALALFLLFVILGCVVYLFFAGGDDEIKEVITPTTEERVADLKSKFNYFGDDDAENDVVTASQMDLSVAPDQEIQASKADKSIKYTQHGDEQAVVGQGQKPLSVPGIAPKPKPKLLYSDKIEIQVMPKPREKPDIISTDIVREKRPQPLLDPSNMAERSPSAIDAEDHHHVVRAQLTNAIERREPVDKIDHVRLELGGSQKIYFFAELQGLSQQYVTVGWYFQDQLTTETKLYIGGDGWRTNARKLLRAQNAGEWRVALSNSTGDVLVERRFLVELIHKP